MLAVQQVFSTDTDKLPPYSIEDAWVPFEHWQTSKETLFNDLDILDPALQSLDWDQYLVATP